MNSEQIEKRRSELYSLERTGEQELELQEILMREMLISKFAYGGSMFDRNGDWDKYLKRYAETLGDERARRIANEQWEYMKQHCTVKYNVCTDSEGCSYNSVIWN